MAELRDRDVNPYAPPASDAHADAPRELDDDAPVVLASTWTRFLARFVDQLLLTACALPAGMTWLAANRSGAAETFSMGSLPPSSIALLFLVGALVIYQWYLVSTSGQTLAKRWLRLRVVKTSGAPVGFLYGVALREWPITGLAAVPVVGRFVNLVDAVMIFGDSRRCLHDHIAGTKVIVVDTK